MSIGDTEIAVDEATHQATAQAEVTLTGISDEVRRDSRRVRFTLREDDGKWRVSSIEVEAKETE